jgi:hypothetical protein
MPPAGFRRGAQALASPLPPRAKRVAGSRGGGCIGSLGANMGTRARGETPHPRPLPTASRGAGGRAHSGPLRGGEIGTAAYSVTGFSEICQSLPSKIEMCSVFIGE